MKIVVVIDGKRNGPHEPQIVMDLYHSGKVNENNLAWKEGMTDWQPLRVVYPELFSKSAEPPTVTAPANEAIEPAGQEAPTAKEITKEPVSTKIPVTEQASGPDEQEGSVEPSQETSTSPPDKLYLGVDGKKCGPFSPDETMAQLLSGEIQSDVLAWRKGMTEWKPLNEVWPDSVNVETTSKKHEADLQASLFERLRDELRKK